jgi:murein DD-endopeptidase MepM/ murein hydrolase activator NlpD
MTFRSILVGSQRSRGTDRRWGSGQFGAPRDNHSRAHRGLDVVASPGDLVFSPVDGNVIREASPYFPFSGVLIQGTGEYASYRVKLFYVRVFMCGPVRAGTLIGRVEDLRWKYPGITNHVHIEVRRDGKIVSPLEAYKMCF